VGKILSNRIYEIVFVNSIYRISRKKSIKIFRFLVESPDFGEAHRKIMEICGKMRVKMTEKLQNRGKKRQTISCTERKPHAKAAPQKISREKKQLVGYNEKCCIHVE
jgi:hypothetical protein